MNKILALLGKGYDDLAKLVLFADGSGHIINESLDGGAGEIVFDFATIAELKRHLTKRVPDKAKAAAFPNSVAVYRVSKKKSLANPPCG